MAQQDVACAGKVNILRGPEEMTMNRFVSIVLATAMLSTPAVAKSSFRKGPAAHNISYSSFSNLDRHNYYTNKDGIIAHSPAKTLDGSVPKNASAKCLNGTYSFSLNRSGTC